ncbi:MAG: helicase C-terminal domain-containing protein [Bacilli bacterium]
MYKFSLSVHDIVDIILRRGHLDTRVFNQSSMQQGTLLHSLYQSEQGKDYISEYPVEYTFVQDEFTFQVSGKADGVIIDKDGNITVEEIKTTVADLDEFIHDHGQWHLGQAVFYAYIIAKQRKLGSVSILMTYMKQNNYRIRKQINQIFKFEELERTVNDVILRYASYCRKIIRFKEERNESVKALSFPFTDLRKGQEEMMTFVTKACDEKKQVFIEAPTGIGKTISVLYPLVKRFGSRKADRIFYLTNKNSIKEIAMSTMRLFDQSGAKTKSIEFTSKENICFNDKKGHCNPVECPFARNYYDKLLDAIFDALHRYDTFDRSVIESLGFEKTMCPYQFQSDLSKYCDVLVCDYSYVYDYHDRLCLEESNIKSTHTFLCVDECHNLPERVREMYSLTLSMAEIEDALSLCTGTEFTLLKEDIKNILSGFEQMSIDPDDENIKRYQLQIIDSVSVEIEDSLNNAIYDIKSILKKHVELITDPLLEFFYKINSLFYLLSLINDPDTHDTFLTYLLVNQDMTIEGIRIANLDSRNLIQKGSDLFESTIYFSATLSPKDYYIDLLAGDVKEESNRLILSSPFDFNNRRVFVNSKLSLKYRDRDNTLFEVFSLIQTACSIKKGNYFVFCPSFEYLDRIRSFFEQSPLENTTIVYQGRSMSENSRNEFLSSFSIDNQNTLIGVMVLGGIFSEGIDLVGDRLIGSIVISVGLPQIGFERDRLKEYYDKLDGGEEKQKGFSYSYSYPGLNRVLQAAGRVIRTENDKGFILFIDSRYKYSLYRTVFGEIYPDCRYLYSNGQLKLELKKFWEDKNDLQ